MNGTKKNRLSQDVLIKAAFAMQAKPDAWYVACKHDPVRIGAAIKSEMGIELNPKQVLRLMASIGRRSVRARGGGKTRCFGMRSQALAMSVAMMLKELGAPIPAILVDIANGAYTVNADLFHALQQKFHVMFPRPVKAHGTDTD